MRKRQKIRRSDTGGLRMLKGWRIK